MKTKEEIAAYMREYRAKHRKRLIEYGRAWYAAMGEEINRRRRKRYATDAEYRERERNRKREYVARKRAEDPQWRRPVKDEPGRPKGKRK